MERWTQTRNNHQGVVSCVGLLFVLCLGCEAPGAAVTDPAAQPTGSARAAAGPSPNDPASSVPPKAEAVPSAASSSSPATRSCPTGMNLIPGGKFWVGTEREVYDQEENPKFSTRVASFCADVHEVSASQYQDCVARGQCAPLSMTNKTCNRQEKGRGDHPINCITFTQATQVCEARSARLLTEIEWEYVARGGAQMLDYPWGNDAPDEHTCWKRPGTCARGEFAAGAFGLHDVVGNVWEWTSSMWGHYPWPTKQGDKRVYRGGSWSRRFDKWMKPTLRNRQAEEEAGSHLGVRCAASLTEADCPYGRDEQGQCRFGVDEVLCLNKQVWNGVRCARAGDSARCLPGAHEEEGFGCVRERVAGTVSQSLDTAAVTRTRSPEFDADCQTNQPSRPHAYRLGGGEHLARNLVGKSLGCKNRDVGVGFNSACCP